MPRLFLMPVFLLALSVSAGETIVGWRNDGTGHYPDANPPTKWSRAINGGKPESTGILWMTPVPTGASAPIVVGERVFFGFGVNGLMCVNKSDGHIFWHRTHGFYEIMPDEQRKTIEEKNKAAYAKVKAHLDAEIKRMSDSVSVSGLSDDNGFMTWMWGMQVNDQQHMIDAAPLEVDKEKYKANRVDWEFSSATPVSDGKFVFMWFSHRVAVCYDLDGNKQWLTIEPGKEKGASEHGRHSSPVLIDDKFIVQYGRDIYAFDRKTGKPLWTKPLEGTQATPAYGSLVTASAGGQRYIVACNGEGLRAADGERGWGHLQAYAGENTTATVEKDRVFIWDRNGLFQMQIPATPGPNVQATVGKSLKFPDMWKNYMIASPLFVNGLVYAVSDRAYLRVFDAEAGSIVYEKQLPLNPHTEYVHYPGLSASPALAGKNIYILDNQGGTLVLEPGREYKEVAVNKLETGVLKGKDKEGKETIVYEQTVSNPCFDGKLMFIRGQKYLYCIGSR